MAPHGRSHRSPCPCNGRRISAFETQVAGGRGPLLDGDGVVGASPVQALALALGSCMGTDVVMILKKGRHDLRGLTVTVVGTRADGPPSRFTSYAIRFEVTGPVPEAAIQRAIDLSRDTYCSVWHSLPASTRRSRSPTLASMADLGPAGTPQVRRPRAGYIDWMRGLAVVDHDPRARRRCVDGARVPRARRVRTSGSW